MEQSRLKAPYSKSEFAAFLSRPHRSVLFRTNRLQSVRFKHKVILCGQFKNWPVNWARIKFPFVALFPDRYSVYYWCCASPKVRGPLIWGFAIVR